MCISVRLLGMFILCLGLGIPFSLSAASAKVTICHIPPGNIENPQTITINENAAPAHLAHGDTVGQCPSGCQTDSECDDGNLCTSDTCLSSGSCSNSLVNCDDGNICTSDSCEPNQGCLNPPNDGIECDDGNACTEVDTCEATICVGTSIQDCCSSAQECDDGNLCTNDVCLSGTCANEIKNCSLDDVCNIPGIENACVVGVCNPSTGACTTLQTSCDDGDICTDDLCDGAVGCFNRPTNSPPEVQEVTCNDNLDNDCDTLVDLNDPDCAEVECNDSTDCGGYLCINNVCTETCTTDSDCSNPYTCSSDNLCVPPEV